MKSINISKNLKRLLSENNKTNIDLSIYLGVTDSLISSYVTKNTLPPVDKIIKISEYFKISIDELIFEKNQNDFNSIQEPLLEYGSNAQKLKCVLTGHDCSFREMDGLRLENEKLRKKVERLEKGK